MSFLKINGGQKLSGRVCVSGSKNAALPILIASLLTDQPCTLTRVPLGLTDIRVILQLLGDLGVQIHQEKEKNQVRVQAQHLLTSHAPPHLVQAMRASVIVLGPLLARLGHARVSAPGGCAIGSRPIQYHLDGLKKLGVQIEFENGEVVARVQKLKGNRIVFEYPSVGATENILMAAVLAHGESILENCAQEPEIADLIQVLKKMGAEIQGEGTSVLQIQGRPELRGCTHAIMGDRIEAGTLLVAGFATQGTVQVSGVDPHELEPVLRCFEKAGAEITRSHEEISLRSVGLPQAVEIVTAPHPGFPTDLQAPWMALMCIAQGCSKITETVFENRFLHVEQLQRLGAQIRVEDSVAFVQGVAVEKLVSGVFLNAPDLRAAASLIIAGLSVPGETRIGQLLYLDRGYENFEEKLRTLGAKVSRVSVTQTHRSASSYCFQDRTREREQSL